MAYEEGTVGWVVEGSTIHHPLTKCTKLEEEKEKGKRAASYSRFNSQKHSACVECSKRFGQGGQNA